MKFTPFGIDIAKHLMQIQFVDEYTGELIDKPLWRLQLTREERRFGHDLLVSRSRDEKRELAYYVVYAP